MKRVLSFVLPVLILFSFGAAFAEKAAPQVRAATLPPVKPEFTLDGKEFYIDEVTNGDWSMSPEDYKKNGPLLVTRFFLKDGYIPASTAGNLCGKMSVVSPDGNKVMVLRFLFRTDNDGKGLNEFYCVYKVPDVEQITEYHVEISGGEPASILFSDYFGNSERAKAAQSGIVLPTPTPAPTPTRDPNAILVTFNWRSHTFSINGFEDQPSMIPPGYVSSKGAFLLLSIHVDDGPLTFNEVNTYYRQLILRSPSNYEFVPVSFILQGSDTEINSFYLLYDVPAAVAPSEFTFVPITGTPAAVPLTDY